MPADEYPLPAFYFKVAFLATQGKSDTSFQEVSGISTEMETEPVTEGGNPYKVQLPKALKHGNLVLKRGIADMNSPLVTLCRETLESDFAVPIEPQQVNVLLMNWAGSPMRGWTFRNAFPVKWSVDSFNSTKNEVAIETIELSYSTSARMF